MEFIDVVQKRRSVRSYMDTPVPENLIMQILECGHMAPTGGNLQPWEFIVLRDEADRRAVADTTFQRNTFDITKNQDWIATAPAIILVLGDRVKAAVRYGQQFSDTLVYLDCSACIENMLLAAVNAGLGACYISGFFEALLAKAFDVPPSHQVVGFITLGYEKGTTASRPKEPLDTKIYYGRYGRRLP